MFPAPSTSPTPPVSAGTRWARPARRRTLASSTPGGIHTSTSKPLNSNRSNSVCGNTRTLTRPPGARPHEKPSSGLPPRSSAVSDSRRAAAHSSTAYGPLNHSSPTSAESRGSPFISLATFTHSPAWALTAALSFEMKGLPRDSTLVGEEWLSSPYAVLECAAALRESLKALERGGSPLDTFSCGRAPGGRVSASGCCRTPCSTRLLFSGFEVDVWMPPGVDEATVRPRAPLAQRVPEEPGGVGLVLGAGNIAQIGTLDGLDQLFAHNRVVVLKLNPVTDVLKPALEARARTVDRAGIP